MAELNAALPSQETRIRFLEARLADAGSILHELVGHRGNIHYRPTTGRVGALECRIRSLEDRLMFVEAEKIKASLLHRNSVWPLNKANNAVAENFDKGRPFTAVAEEQEDKLDVPEGEELPTREWIHNFPIESQEKFDEMRVPFKKQRLAHSDPDSQQAAESQQSMIVHPGDASEQELADLQQPDDPQQPDESQKPDDSEDK